MEAAREQQKSREATHLAGRGGFRAHGEQHAGSFVAGAGEEGDDSTSGDSSEEESGMEDVTSSTQQPQQRNTQQEKAKKARQHGEHGKENGVQPPRICWQTK